MSSGQNERTFEGGGGGGMVENEQGWARGEGEESKLGNVERMYFLNVPLQCGREYGFGTSKLPLHQTTQLHKLQPEELKSMPTNNMIVSIC